MSINATTVHVEWNPSKAETWEKLWENLTGRKTGYRAGMADTVMFAGLKTHEVYKILPYIRPTLSFMAVPIDSPEQLAPGTSMTIADVAMYNRRAYDQICAEKDVPDDDECRKACIQIL